MRNQDNWQLYYEKTSTRGPRETLLDALNLFPKEYRGLAFDIGSGACNEVKHLLDIGWKVIAVDNEKKAKEYYEKFIPSNALSSFQLASFEEIEWQKADIVHAGFALAFCPKEYMMKVLQNIKENLNENGVFAGNFFGPEHTWSHLCLLSKNEILDCFKDFEILKIEETKEAKIATLGEKLSHHNITLIAKKTNK